MSESTTNTSATGDLLAIAREAVSQQDLASAETAYQKVLQVPAEANERTIADQETSLNELGLLYRDHNKAQELSQLIQTSRTVMGGFAKSKTAKIMRSLIDLFATLPDTLDLQIATTQDCVEWAIAEKRNFLKINLQTRLINFYFKKQAYFDAIAIIDGLLRELKRLDDKSVLVEVQLLEARTYHALRNIPKSRAALTGARTSANTIYTPPLMQAGLDHMSGILQAEEKDYKTAFSYFYEAFEGYASQEDARAITILKYMLLCKVMLNLSDDVISILNGKLASKYVGRDIDALKAIAAAHKNRSLKEFELALETYRTELSQDTFIRSHFSALYDSLLEQNLVKVIEPFSCVEMAHIAELIGLDTRQVEGKLSQMILDKVFYGVLDQGNGWLYVYDEPQRDVAYDAALDTVKQMSNVVDALYEKAASL
ncbi:PCI-domain-containing protein [Nadsonia fulvescens var. elongata DSM 6958]|uniref:PCI-domain-containing protein n=1 Tax=Nadsonia fulvescens var. elongata DSM 6958 TaxID=857566 RepID=A0A1E3PI61_9ASCO|nr:PCI-domain-containing protein [Nadsonia fulvescens var. elongata DSM 6958]